jgi:hypothetical protein
MVTRDVPLRPVEPDGVSLVVSRCIVQTVTLRLEPILRGARDWREQRARDREHDDQSCPDLHLVSFTAPAAGDTWLTAS